MNLIKARKLGHDGWVRSPSRTDNEWLDTKEVETWCRGDIDAEDWEPKPEPKKLFEAEVWVHPVVKSSYFVGKCHDEWSWTSHGWRKIRVREVSE